MVNSESACAGDCTLGRISAEDSLGWMNMPNTMKPAAAIPAASHAIQIVLMSA